MFIYFFYSVYRDVISDFTIQYDISFDKRFCRFSGRPLTRPTATILQRGRCWRFANAAKSPAPAPFPQRTPLFRARVPSPRPDRLAMYLFFIPSIIPVSVCLSLSLVLSLMFCFFSSKFHGDYTAVLTFRRTLQRVRYIEREREIERTKCNGHHRCRLVCIKRHCTLYSSQQVKWRWFSSKRSVIVRNWIPKP